MENLITSLKKDLFLLFRKRDYFSQKIEYLFIFSIILIILCIRLYNIHSPSLDRTAWKEIDYIDISKNYVSNNFNFIKPTIQWPAEPPRVTAMECPIVPYFTSFLYPVFGFNVYTVRFITLVGSLLLIIMVYKLMKFHIGQLRALLAAFFAGFMPLNSPFNGLLYSEPTMILFSVTAIYYFSKWIANEKRKDFLIACVSFSLAILLKLEPIYLLLPFLGLFFYKYRLQIRSYKKLVLFVVLAFIPPAIWYSYAYYLTFHSIDVFGIFKGHDKMQTFAMVSDPVWWKGTVKNIISIAGGQFGMFLVFTGFVTLLFTRSGLIFVLYLLSILIYFLIVAEGLKDGPYRALTIVPVFACLASIGTLSLGILVYYSMKFLSQTMFSRLTLLNTAMISSISAIFLITVIRLNIVLRNDPLSPSHREWYFAQKIKSYVAPGTKIITAGTYTIHKGGVDLSPVLYYYTGVQGYTLQKESWHIDTIKKYQKKCRPYLAICEINREKELYDFVEKLKKHYKPIIYDEKNQWILFYLSQNK